MWEWLSEPGIIAATALLAVTASQAIGAVWARRDFLALTEVALSVAENPDIPHEEKQELSIGMRLATSWYSTPALVVGVPIMVTYVVIKAITLTLSGRRLTEAALFGKFSNSSKYADQFNRPLWKSKPLVAIWAVLWFLPALLTLVIVMRSTKLATEIARRAALTLFARVAHH